MSTAKKPILASRTGLLSALKTFRETAKSYYVTYYGEGGREIRIPKSDQRRRIFYDFDEAVAWTKNVGPD